MNLAVAAGDHNDASGHHIGTSRPSQVPVSRRRTDSHASGSGGGGYRAQKPTSPDHAIALGIVGAGVGGQLAADGTGGPSPAHTGWIAIQDIPVFQTYEFSSLWALPERLCGTGTPWSWRPGPCSYHVPPTARRNNTPSCRQRTRPSGRSWCRSCLPRSNRKSWRRYPCRWKRSSRPRIPRSATRWIRRTPGAGSGWHGRPRPRSPPRSKCSTGRWVPDTRRHWPERRQHTAISKGVIPLEPRVTPKGVASIWSGSTPMRGRKSTERSPTRVISPAATRWGLCRSALRRVSGPA